MVLLFCSPTCSSCQYILLGKSAIEPKNQSQKLHLTRMNSLINESSTIEPKN
jgi:hypothetical protein